MSSITQHISTSSLSAHGSDFGTVSEALGELLSSAKRPGRGNGIIHVNYDKKCCNVKDYSVEPHSACSLFSYSLRLYDLTLYFLRNLHRNVNLRKTFIRKSITNLIANLLDPLHIPPYKTDSDAFLKKGIGSDANAFAL